MVRLWLDDVRPAPEGWVHACTAQAAISILNVGNVTEISFDHDLGPDNAGTGYDVACAIEEGAYDSLMPKLKWAIHSANPVGRERITSAMNSAERWWRIDG